MGHLANLKKPITWLFGIGNGLIWTLFCVRLGLDWHALSGRSRWSGVLLAVAFASLWYSLIKDKDKASHLFAATMSFLATMLAVSGVF
jgi:hypothetical protein